MAHYFFNIHNSIGAIADEEGRDLPDLASARAEALKGARSLIAAAVLEGWLDLDGRLEITDPEGKLLFVTHYTDAVSFDGRHPTQG
ncbi:MAG: DUF6894 family protein [Sphingosinicella sp.]